MIDELNGTRPSRLSPVYRKHQRDRLLDWTRCVDGDWRWYCPVCSALVILQEEKADTAKEMGWSATRRAATGHADAPWAWLIVTHPDGSYTVTGTSASKSFGPLDVGEDVLIRMIEKAFLNHYRKTGHPLPDRVAA